jgi:hypothetical protein
MFSLGTDYTLSPEYRLARGNPQWPEVLDLFGQSKIVWFVFLADLKVPSKRREKNHPVRFGGLQNLLGKNMLEYELQNG